MAEEKKRDEQQGAGKKIIIFAVLGVLILGLGIGGTVFFMISKPAPGQQSAEEMAAAKAAQEPEEIIYHELHPAFIANFSGRSNKNYMQVYIVALASKKSAIDDLTLHMPAVRNDILMTLGRVSSDQIETVEGKEALRLKVLATLRQTIKMKTGREDDIKDIYFTKFVAQ